MKKIIVVVFIYATLLFIAFLYRKPLLDWVRETDYSQLPFMFVLALLFSVIPIVPYSVFAGLMGAKYGILLGAVVNWVGAVGAAMIFFLLIRYLFYTPFQRWMERYEKVQKFDDMFARNGFIAVLFGRMIPIIPMPVINIYSGLSTMPFSQYMLATAIGQIPDVVLFAYLGNQLFRSFESAVYGFLIYASFLLIVFFCYYWWYKVSGVKG